MADPVTDERMAREALVAVVVRLYDEVWNAGRYDVAAELIDPEFTYPAAPGLRGADAKLAAIRAHRASCPDLLITLDEVLADDVASTVAARWTITGTDTGGIRGRPPSGRAFRSWGCEHFTLRSGRIVANWVGIDWLGVLIQLGAVDDPWA